MSTPYYRPTLPDMSPRNKVMRELTDAFYQTLDTFLQDHPGLPFTFEDAIYAVTLFTKDLIALSVEPDEDDSGEPTEGALDAS